MLLKKGLFRISGWFLVPDIQYTAGFLTNAGYPANYRISGIRNQPDILYPDSFNIRYPLGYWKWPDTRPNPTKNLLDIIFFIIFVSMGKYWLAWENISKPGKIWLSVGIFAAKKLTWYYFHHNVTYPPFSGRKPSEFQPFCWPSPSLWEYLSFSSDTLAHCLCRWAHLLPRYIYWSGLGRILKLSGYRISGWFIMLDIWLKNNWATKKIEKPSKYFQDIFNPFVDNRWKRTAKYCTGYSKG